MITFQKLTPKQAKWLSLIKDYFSDWYSSGTITHKQLVEAHEKFMSLRKEDPSNKVGWPIWLIMGNNIGRGLYQLPVPKFKEVDEVDPDSTHEFYPEYVAELKEFGVV
jgi:hypothetical protein